MATSDSDAGDGSPRDVPRIVRTEDVLGGDPRIEGHRVGVFDVYRRYVDDEHPESIAAAYDLTVAEVHAALAYAFHNPEEIRAIEEREVEPPGDRIRPDEET